jgi:16S rRNA (cytidine1402-2'-O)-methyltransferase
VLTVVPTPIGNLGDLSQRAREALMQCDLVAAEDTRHSGVLLKLLGIEKNFVSLHGHNEHQRAAGLVERMQAGLAVALVTDAGTPGISDPGGRLIRSCREAGVRVEVLPGPCAAITGLVGSGFDASAFYFGGFLPVKSGRRAAVLGEALERMETSVFYESPHRIAKALGALATIEPMRRVCVARELTKKFEEYRVGTASELAVHYGEHPARGEICLVIEGAEATQRATA